LRKRVRRRWEACLTVIICLTRAGFKDVSGWRKCRKMPGKQRRAGFRFHFIRGDGCERGVWRVTLRGAGGFAP